LLENKEESRNVAYRVIDLNEEAKQWQSVVQFIIDHSAKRSSFENLDRNYFTLE